ncbi:hypothetical protein ACF0H5_011200 [Mactra antiquata]
MYQILYSDPQCLHYKMEQFTCTRYCTQILNVYITRWNSLHVPYIVLRSSMSTLQDGTVYMYQILYSDPQCLHYKMEQFTCTRHCTQILNVYITRWNSLHVPDTVLRSSMSTLQDGTVYMYQILYSDPQCLYSSILYHCTLP